MHGVIPSPSSILPVPLKASGSFVMIMEIMGRVENLRVGSQMRAEAPCTGFGVF